MVAKKPIISHVAYSPLTQTLTFYGPPLSFPSPLEANVFGIIHPAIAQVDTEVVFGNMPALNDGDDIILLPIGAVECFVKWTYSTAGITEEEGNQISIKQNEQISLFDGTGRLIKKIVSPRNFTKKEIFLVKDLFNNLILPFGFYFWSSTEVTQKFVR
jgi:hypothetical protein